MYRQPKLDYFDTEESFKRHDSKASPEFSFSVTSEQIYGSILDRHWTTHPHNCIGCHRQPIQQISASTKGHDHCNAPATSVVSGFG